MGPLAGVKVTQLAGQGPVPFACLLLADMGATVTRVDPPGAPLRHPLGILQRGSRSAAVDLKSELGQEVGLRLAAASDILLEGFRPGVAERLGVGPERCLAANPRLVYGRMSAFGQDGPYSARAGHDINAIAVAGVLEPIGRRGQKPTPPLALVGDMGGGGALLALAAVAALLHARETGEGQVIDASMAEGAALLGTYLYRSWALGEIRERGTNMLDSGAHFYEVYETADGRYVAVGAIEEPFYRALLEVSGLAAEPLPEQWDRERWPELKERLAEVFRRRTQAEWCALMDRFDACLAPVHSPGEAPLDLHSVARGSFLERAAVVQPAPAPRFGKTPSEAGVPPSRLGEHTDEVLAELGYSAAERARLREARAVA